MTSLSTNCRTVVTISVWNSVSPSVWASLVMRDPASLLAWSRADPLEHGGQALPSADAHGFQPIAGAAAVQFARQRREHPAAGPADRGSERDPRTMDIRPFQVARGELPFPHHRERLGREGLVERDQVDIGEFEARLGQRR